MKSPGNGKDLLPTGRLQRHAHEVRMPARLPAMRRGERVDVVHAWGAHAAAAARGRAAHALERVEVHRQVDRRVVRNVGQVGRAERYVAGLEDRVEMIGVELLTA